METASIELMELYVSGGRHIHWDSEDEREEIIEALGGEPDAVFVERRNEPDDNREQLRNLVAAPLILLALVLWTLLLKVLSIPFGSDKELVDGLSDRPDVDIVKVDMPITPLISEARKAWAPLNWLAVILATSTYFRSGVYAALIVLIVLTVLLFISFVAGTAAPRNYAIAVKIMEAAAKNDYKRGVVRVGGEHAEEVKRHIRSINNGITVVDA